MIIELQGGARTHIRLRQC